jgi:hypothetical protein
MARRAPDVVEDRRKLERDALAAAAGARLLSPLRARPAP